MKRIKLKSGVILLIIAFFTVYGSAFAQNEIIQEKRDVGTFTGIDAGGAFHIILSQGADTEVIVETEAKYMEKVRTKVSSGILVISSKGIKKVDKLRVYIKAPDIDNIYIHGAASLDGKTTLSGDIIMIKASGASDGTLDVSFDEIITQVSGAASLDLSGKARKHTVEVSGAADLNAAKLATSITNASASGASSAKINASDEIISYTKGAGSIDLVNKPESLTIVSGDFDGEYESIKVETNGYGDTTKVKVAGIRVEVVEDDSTKITIGNRKLIVEDDGNIRWCKVKRRKFNGHWAGVELGMNGYLTKDFNMKFDPEDEYMDLRMEKSMQFNLNLYEQNFGLSENQQWGMLTGIGMSWNNYRFSKPTTLYTDSSYLIGYVDKGIDVRKSKLSICYLQIPLIFEWQNQARRQVNQVHVGLGVVFGVRMWSWTKKYYDEQDKDYILTQYDPQSESYVDRWQKTSPSDPKVRDYDDFNLQPFKADATFRIGWGYVNLFATYNLVPMFRADKGPELHQFAAGITLLGW